MKYKLQLMFNLVKVFLLLVWPNKITLSNFFGDILWRHFRVDLRLPCLSSPPVGQGPSVTFLILSPGPAWQSVNSRKQTLLYVFPSDPHTGSYSLSQFPLQDSMEEMKIKMNSFYQNFSTLLENERTRAIAENMHFRKYPEAVILVSLGTSSFLARHEI